VVFGPSESVEYYQLNARVLVRVLTDASGALLGSLAAVFGIVFLLKLKGAKP
jgi:hypothetical protein